MSSNVLPQALSLIKLFEAGCRTSRDDSNSPSMQTCRKKEPQVCRSAASQVFCLQEVDELWAGKLHAHFQRRGWHFAPRRSQSRVPSRRVATPQAKAYAMTPLTQLAEA